MNQKVKRILCTVSVAAVILAALALGFQPIVNKMIDITMGGDFPQLEGTPEIGKWYAVDVDTAVSSDGSKWQGYFRKGSENKVVLYFYGGGFSVNDDTAARSMDVEGGFYNPRMNTGLNVMTYAIKEWGIGGGR